MRLGCPGCGAQYEVGADAIPGAGREVTCSACGHRWFQDRPPAAKPLELVRPLARPVQPPPAPADFRAFLREEAERETAQRRRDGVPPPTAPAPARRRRGFLTGVLLAIVPLGLLAALYVTAPRLEREVPALAVPLDRYADHVDALRLQVHDWLRQVR
ncbi:zinc-ribbon domain-containing protein [Falsirhodobacter sp. 20TX0035]|uniref:zinc-ribbon domain-containing protein n=1 Tax=Falsirhodobacter sp. 20TX0035 TaxID=3022019 RepID=UPI002330FEE5|nr:zinc-ribbon domain-containing protein [Falsirhodobacter sp. 20TX0035]MDB6452448.1 zinc-ribbon domain-containing protein [Falsirhodobacter sp. 20TX0035]